MFTKRHAIYPSESHVIKFYYSPDPISAFLKFKKPRFLFPGEETIIAYGDVINEQKIPTYQMSVLKNIELITTDGIKIKCDIKFDFQLDLTSSPSGEDKKNENRKKLEQKVDNLLGKLNNNSVEDVNIQIANLIPINGFLMEYNSLDFIWFELSKDDSDVAELRHFFNPKKPTNSQTDKEKKPNDNTKDEKQIKNSDDTTRAEDKIIGLIDKFPRIKDYIDKLDKDENRSKSQQLSDKIKTCLKLHNLEYIDKSLELKLLNKDELLSADRQKQGTILDDYLLIKKVIEKDKEIAISKINELTYKEELELKRDRESNEYKNKEELARAKNDYDTKILDLVDTEINNLSNKLKKEREKKEKDITHKTYIELLEIEVESLLINKRKDLHGKVNEDYVNLDQLKLIKDKQFELKEKKLELQVAEKKREISEQEKEKEIYNAKLNLELELQRQIMNAYVSILGNVTQQELLLNFNKLDFEQREKMLQTIGAQVSNVVKEFSASNPNLNMYNVSTQDILTSLGNYFSNEEISKNPYLGDIFNFFKKSMGKINIPANIQQNPASPEENDSEFIP